MKSVRRWLAGAILSGILLTQTGCEPWQVAAGLSAASSVLSYFPYSYYYRWYY